MRSEGTAGAQGSLGKSEEKRSRKKKSFVDTCGGTASEQQVSAVAPACPQWDGVRIAHMQLV